jgi:hypothetical protein
MAAGTPILAAVPPSTPILTIKIRLSAVFSVVSEDLIRSELLSILPMMMMMMNRACTVEVKRTDLSKMGVVPFAD